MISAMCEGDYGVLGSPAAVRSKKMERKRRSRRRKSERESKLQGNR